MKKSLDVQRGKLWLMLSKGAVIVHLLEAFEEKSMPKECTFLYVFIELLTICISINMRVFLYKCAVVKVNNTYLTMCIQLNFTMSPV